MSKSTLSQLAKSKLYSPLYNSVTKLIRTSGITENPPFTRLCRASSLPISKEFHGFKVFSEYEPPEFEMPLFYVQKEEQIKHLKNYQHNPNLKPYQSGIICASNVDVSFPYPIHRWQGKVFIEALRENKKYMSEPRYLIALESIPFTRKKKMPESILLTMPSQDNYYHWLVEVLPRLQMIESDEYLSKLPLILPQIKCPKFIKETLNLLRFNERVIFLENGVYRFEKLYIPTLLSPPSHPSPLAIKWLRNKFIEKSFYPEKKRIYVSRKDSSFRYISNENELEQCLNEHGFRTVCMSDYSFEEQVKIFQEAEVIIGSHGAALTNLVFTSSDSLFIELFRENWFTNAYYHIAGIRKLRYGFLVCRQDGDGQYVNINDLRSILEKALHTSSSS